METKTSSSEKHASKDSIKIPVKWAVSAIVLIAVIVLVFLLLNSGILSKTTSSEVSEKEAVDKVLNFVVTQAPDSNVTFVSSSKEGSLYKITLNIDGQEVPVYATSDGKYLVVDMIPLN